MSCHSKLLDVIRTVLHPSVSLFFLNSFYLLHGISAESVSLIPVDRLLVSVLVTSPSSGRLLVSVLLQSLSFENLFVCVLSLSFPFHDCLCMPCCCLLLLKTACVCLVAASFSSRLLVYVLLMSLSLDEQYSPYTIRALTDIAITRIESNKNQVATVSALLAV